MWRFTRLLVVAGRCRRSPGTRAGPKDGPQVSEGRLPDAGGGGSCLEPHPTPCSTRSNHSHRIALHSSFYKLVWSRGRGARHQGLVYAGA